MPRAITYLIASVGAFVFALSGIAADFEVDFFGGALSTSASTFFLATGVIAAISAVLAFAQAASRR